MVLQGVTDNLGNTFALTKLMTSKFPLVVILSEVAAQLRARQMSLHLGWAPRDQNEEADVLTNGDFSQFDVSRRIPVDVQTIPWHVLPRMLRMSEDIYGEVQRKKIARARSPGEAPAPKRGKNLRQRDPW